MATRLRTTDVVVVGLGWTGAILANELADEGLRIVAIERGPWRNTGTDFPPTYAPDELRYAIRQDLFVRTAQSTLTFRNNQNQTALPIRTWGSFLPPNGVGGGGVHWNAETFRFLPSDFVLRSHLEQRYGKQFLPAETTIQDWGVTYDELEPFYDKFEYLCGTSGQAGNLNGKIIQGGNVFEGPRSRPYPTPPQKQPYLPTAFAKFAAELGYHPYPQPSGNLSQEYINPLGVAVGQCSFCGFCERFGCGNYSKASPQTTILPVLVGKPNFTARTECEVTRINLDSTGKRATGVTYVDASGAEFEQPADLVLLCAFQLFNVMLLMNSGIGQIYDPQTGKGQIGRNYSYQTTSSVRQFFDDSTTLNPFIASGAIGVIIDDFNGDNFDHGPHGFIGGAYMGPHQSHGRPIEQRQVPPGTPKWGAAWKSATQHYYQRNYDTEAHGSCYSYRGNYLDLDPTYTDRFGRKLMRMTFDFDDNEIKMSKFVTDKLAEIMQHAPGVKQTVTLPRTKPYNIVPYQTTHTVGGAIMGTNPSNSALNRYLQSWDVPNLFVMGATCFPQNPGYNPTGTVGALTYWTAKALREQYLKHPGPLVQA